MVMRTRHLLARRLNLALLVGTAVILLGSVPAKAVTSITTCPYPITAAGTYEVDADLTCPGKVGIEIQASHVYLNLNGHIISDGIEAGILVEPSGPGPLTDIHILGPGLIQKFPYGIVFLKELADSEVRNVTLANNGNDGIVAEPTGSVRGLYLTANVVVSNGESGIVLNNSTDGQLLDNDVTANGGDGIDLLAGSGNVLHGNRAEGNPSIGIYLQGSTNNEIDGNATNGNGDLGMFVDRGSTGNDIRNNQSTGNAATDMDDGNTPSCDSNHWNHNTFFTFNLSCIH